MNKEERRTGMNIKKTVLVVALLALAFTAWGAELNGDATWMRENTPGIYEVIKSRAVEEWGDDHSMVLYEINRQCESFSAVVALMDTADVQVQGICYAATAEWTEGGYAAIAAALDSPDPRATFKLDTDWTMVEYKILKQIEAVGAY